jgi:hypothetical protein
MNLIFEYGKYLFLLLKPIFYLNNEKNVASFYQINKSTDKRNKNLIFC